MGMLGIVIGIRQLRSDLAALVRRAEAGERVVVTIGSRPAAVLGPLSATPTTDLAALIASGALIPARRADHRHPEGTVPVWGNVRLDRLLAEIRG